MERFTNIRARLHLGRLWAVVITVIPLGIGNVASA